MYIFAYFVHVHVHDLYRKKNDNTFHCLCNREDTKTSKTEMYILEDTGGKYCFGINRLHRQPGSLLHDFFYVR
jgi:hypothetical protein